MSNTLPIIIYTGNKDKQDNLL